MRRPDRRLAFSMSTLGIDYGTRKVGLAKAAEGTPAVPLAVWTYKNRRELLARISELCQREGVDAIVIGLPLPVRAGVTSAGVAAVQRFATALQQAAGRPVSLHDERLTTKEARRLHQGSRDEDDATAAMLILQSWLDSSRGG